MEILELINRLEGMVTDSKRVPLSKNVMVDPAKMLELVDQMRLAVPRGIQEAQEVLERREQILNQSMLDAKRIKAAAENESRNRVDDSTIVLQAKKRGEELLGETEAKAKRLLEQTEMEIRRRRGDADKYAQEVLTKLEEEVNGLLGTIRRGQAALGHKEAEPAVDIGRPSRSAAISPAPKMPVASSNGNGTKAPAGPSTRR